MAWASFEERWTIRVLKNEWLSCRRTVREQFPKASGFRIDLITNRLMEDQHN